MAQEGRPLDAGRWGDDGSPGDFRWGSIESALALTYFANEPVLGGRTH